MPLPIDRRGALGLSLATVRGLRAGTLLVPEGPPAAPPKPGGA